MLILITILTTLTLTTTIAVVYAGGEDDDGDGNKQKAEGDSAAAIADCDENDVERAGFDCIAIAESEVEIEPPEESTTLIVCKVAITGGFFPEDFDFTVTGNNPFPAQFTGDDSDGCVDVTIGPGEYAVSETSDEAISVTFIEGNCEQDPNDAQRATGEIQAGETQMCIFTNFIT
jgi:hypothetical protein